MKHFHDTGGEQQPETNNGDIHDKNPDGLYDKDLPPTPQARLDEIEEYLDKMKDEMDSANQEDIAGNEVVSDSEQDGGNNSEPIKKYEEINKKQEIADNAAKEYNNEKKPYDRALAKGLEGVTKTPNDGVSFAGSPYIYETDSGKKGVVSIVATGSRTADFNAANKAMGLKDTPDGYVWHHVDDYNVKDGTITLELVRDDAHNAVKPHSGGCAQYDAVNGASYNPPRKEA